MSRVFLAARGQQRPDPLILGLLTMSVMMGCFEELDPPSPCYNLSETEIPQSLPEGVRGSLIQYQFLYLRDQAAHCEVKIASGDEQSECTSFNIDNLHLNPTDESARAAEFPGLDCVSFIPIEDEDFGYCDVLSSASSDGCRCLFDIDCARGRCYPNSAYDFDCPQPPCTQCFTAEEAPAKRPPKRPTER